MLARRFICLCTLLLLVFPGRGFAQSGRDYIYIVGSSTVYPFATVVAEQFGTLARLFPGRIELGLGRAPGTDMATARALRRHILEGHRRIHSCHITEAGPALGVHMGIGGLIVGFLPDPHELKRGPNAADGSGAREDRRA